MDKNQPTVTRTIGVKLPNGRVIECVVEAWLMAIIQLLPDDHLTAICNRAEKLQMQLSVTQLDSGLAILKKPISSLEV